MQSGFVAQVLLVARLLQATAIFVADFSARAVPDVIAVYAVATFQYLFLVASLERYPYSFAGRC